MYNNKDRETNIVRALINLQEFHQNYRLELEKERDELLEELEDAEFALIVEKRKGDETVEVDLGTLREGE